NNIIIDLLKVDKNFICKCVVHRSVTIWVFPHHLKLLCIKLVPAFHMILLIIDYVVDLNNNITIEILSICAPIDRICAYLLMLPHIRLTKEKHVRMNDLRRLDHYMYSVYMYICLCTYRSISNMYNMYCLMRNEIKKLMNKKMEGNGVYINHVTWKTHISLLAFQFRD
ncbi:hypothetical protein ACJX0J_026071, partial [Zea mays]